MEDGAEGVEFGDDSGEEYVDDEGDYGGDFDDGEE